MENDGKAATMAKMRYRWAKIRGAYRLSRRNIARIVAAISAAMLWFPTADASDEHLIIDGITLSGWPYYDG